MKILGIIGIAVLACLAGITVFHGACIDKQCLFPRPCKNLIADHSDYVSLLRKLRGIPGVKKVFVRSGVRFDYALADKDDTFIRELCLYHISGQLRVAPEHGNLSPDQRYRYRHQQRIPGTDV